MFPAEPAAVLAAQYIYWALLPCVLFAPVRWAVLIWLVMGNLDTTGPSSAASANIGWMNASKGILLPLYLGWRLRGRDNGILRTIPAKLWLTLVVYAAVAGLWSPFPLAAAKLVGNLIGTFLAFVVLQKAAHSALLNGRVMVMLVLVSLSLGVLQTFYYGGEVYGFDGAARPTRFSSFTGAQQYAAFLVAFLATVLWHPELRSRTRLWLSGAIAAAIALNGSRIWSLGATVVVMVYLSLSFKRVVVHVVFTATGLAFGLLLLLNLNPTDMDILGDTSSRIVATLSALLTGQDTSQNTGLANLNFRLAIYRNVIDELRNARASDLVFGHGTSSGGNVVLHVYPQSYKVDRLDANRAIHNEWLRVLYEWGIIGLGTLTAVFIAIVAGLVRCQWIRGGKLGPQAAFSFLPAFVIALSAENLLAGAGNAATLSLALVVALTWSPRLARALPRILQCEHSNRFGDVLIAPAR
jgi:hypothetical protein